MKILFITSRLPYPPYRGDKLRTYNFIKTLSQRHEIHLVSFCESQKDYRFKKELSLYCKTIRLVYLPKWLSWLKTILLYWSKNPSQVAYYFSLRMFWAVNNLAKKEKFDLAYVHLFRMYQYCRVIPKNIYTIIDLTDVISKEMFRSVGENYGLRYRLVINEANKIKSYENKIIDLAKEIWVISEKEKADLAAVNFGGNVRVVVNGVESKFSDKQRTSKNAVLFFGYSSTSHNKTALNFLIDKIMPELKKIIPEITLNVFGAGKWGTAKKTKDEFPVNNLGFIREPIDVFAENSVMVAPILYSAGTQNKILEAMNSGIPVITSDFGNEGIGAAPGKEIIICSSATDYVAQIARVLSDDGYGSRIGSSGQKYVRANFLWDNVSERVSEIEKTLKSQILKPNL